MTTATGPRRRRCGFCPPSYQRQVSLLRRLDEGGCEGRSLAFVFVLEEHERVIPRARLCRNRISPPIDVGGHVAFIAQAEVAVPGSRNERRGLVTEVRDAQG